MSDERAAPVLFNQRYVFSTIQGMVLVDSTEILYIKSDDRYARLMLTTGENHFINVSMKELEVLLPQDHFVRVHQSYIVSTNSIRKIQKASEGLFLILKDKTTIPLSRRNKDVVNRWLGMGEMW
jgi:two-component system, LytTR family, response regulator